LGGRTLDTVAEFLVETYVAREDGASVARRADRARDAADRLTREGTPVEFIRWIFVPEDETCFYLYEASSADLVHAAARSAHLRFERVVKTVAQPRRGHPS
jgi:hypothetical protein